MTSSPRALQTLERLTELLLTELPIAAHDHLLEPGGLHAVRLERGQLWVTLRHHPPPSAPTREPYEYAIALMPEATLERPAEAELRLLTWLRVLREIFTSTPRPEALKGLSLGHLAVRKVAKTKRFASAEEVLEVYLSDPHVGALMPLPEVRDEGGRGPAELVEGLLEELLPARGALFELGSATPWQGEEEAAVVAIPGRGIRATLQLIVWEEREGHRSIRDIKEQEVFVLPPAAFLHLGRVEPCLRGWVAALEQAFASASLRKLEVSMPHDFAHPEVFLLKKPRSAEDFREAFAVPSRLGKWSA